MASPVVAILAGRSPSESIEFVESTANVSFWQRESNRVDVAEKDVEESADVIFGREFGQQREENVGPSTALVDNLAKDEVGLGCARRECGRVWLGCVGIAANFGLDRGGRNGRKCVTTEIITGGSCQSPIKVLLALFRITSLARRRTCGATGGGRLWRSRCARRCRGFFTRKKVLEEVFDAAEAGAKVAVLVAVLEWPARVCYAPLSAGAAGDLAVALVFAAVTLKKDESYCRHGGPYLLTSTQA